MTTVHGTQRLPAAERRAALVEAALRVFVSRSYAGATTAEIAREAGVSEPILYRHFHSKRDLYLACLDEAWGQLRDALDANLEKVGPENGVLALSRIATTHRPLRVLTPNLWIQGLSEATEEPELRRHLRRHMRVAHEHVAGILRRAQEAGGLPLDRDPDAEAWIFIAGGLLVTVADRLGGVLNQEAFAAISRERKRWLTGPALPRRP